MRYGASWWWAGALALMLTGCGGSGGSSSSGGGGPHEPSAPVSCRDDAGARACTWSLPANHRLSASDADIIADQLTRGPVTLQTDSDDLTLDIAIRDDVGSGYGLILSSSGDIIIDHPLSVDRLTLKYGQGSAEGAGHDYVVRAPVSLPEGDHFTTHQGSGDLVGTSWWVITRLGDEGDTSTETLQGIRNHLTGHYVLGADIDASATVGWDGGFEPIGDNSTRDINSRFSGGFDGLGHVIHGLTINRAEQSFVGLFGYTWEAALRHVGLETATIMGRGHVGGLAGVSIKSSHRRSHVNGHVRGDDRVGGLVGYNEDGSVLQSYALGVVSGLKYVGGMVGYQISGTVDQSYFSGGVTGSDEAGGLVGRNSLGAISHSYASGGVVGSGTDIGGLVGFSYGGPYSGFPSIRHSYASAVVSGAASNRGGLVGRISQGDVTASFWSMTGNGDLEGIGNASRAGLSGKSLIELMQIDTFVAEVLEDEAWDITADVHGDSVWLIEDGMAPPRLRGLGGPGPVILPPVADAQAVGTALNSPLAITLTGSSHAAKPLTYTVVSGPEQGSLSGDPPNLIYTPDTDFAGMDHFVFRVSADHGDSAPATVTIAVTNSTPVADSQRVTTGDETPVEIMLTGSDADGDTLSYTVVSEPANGSLSGIAPALIYTPDSGFAGEDSFAFIVNDGREDSLPATVHITVGSASFHCTSGAGDCTWSLTGGYLLTTADAAEIEAQLALGPVTVGHSGRDLVLDVGIRDDSGAGHALTLSSSGDIVLNQPLSVGRLVLKYGLGSADGQGHGYIVQAPVNLPEGNHFITHQGSDDEEGTPWWVITRLGEDGDDSTETLQGMRNHLDGYYVLGADIDASETRHWSNGGFQPVGHPVRVIDTDRYFVGGFDGLGHVIRGLTIRTGQNYASLFGAVQEVRLRHVGLEDVDIKGHNYTGGLVGWMESSTVSHSYVSGSVSGNDFVGGLAGRVGGSTLARSYFSGSMLGTGARAGGLVGLSTDSVIRDTYASGSVRGNSVVGGLLGAGYDGSVRNSYVSSIVRGNAHVGALVAEYNAASPPFTASFWSTTGNEDLPGVRGGNATRTGVFGQPLSALMQKATFNAEALGETDWDISTDPASQSTWLLEEGALPRLRGLRGPGTVFAPPVAMPQNLDSERDTPLLLTLTGHSYTGQAPGYIVIDSPQHGSLTGSAASLTYTPDPGFVGEDRFTFVVNDGEVDSPPATVTISVHAYNASHCVTGPSHCTWRLTGGYLLTSADAAEIGTQLAHGPVEVYSEAARLVIPVEIRDTSGEGHGLTLASEGDLVIRQSISVDHLTLKIGQGSADGAGHDYVVQAPVHLPEGSHFVTHRGSDDLIGTSWWVITRLGDEGDTSTETLQGIRNHLTGHYVLGADIDASATAGWDGGFEPIGNNSTGNINSRFSGRFDGLGHVISHLTIDRPEQNFVGLFGYTWEAVLRHVGLEGLNVRGHRHVGGLAGVNIGGTFYRNHVNGLIQGWNNHVGGLTGYAESAVIRHSMTTGQVHGEGNHIGGLVGESHHSTLRHSYADMQVMGSGNDVGGLIGWAHYGTIHHSYARGPVVGGGIDIGGLVGRISHGDIVASFWNMTGNEALEGIGNASRAGLFGKSLIELMQLDTFAATALGTEAWDISADPHGDSIWLIEENVTTPMLRGLMLTPGVAGGHECVMRYTGDTDC